MKTLLCMNNGAWKSCMGAPPPSNNRWSSNFKEIGATYINHPKNYSLTVVVFQVCHAATGLTSHQHSEWVSRVLRPTRHNRGHFGGGPSAQWTINKPSSSFVKRHQWMTMWYIRLLATGTEVKRHLFLYAYAATVTVVTRRHSTTLLHHRR